jgi:hypothetical protein
MSVYYSLEEITKGFPGTIPIPEGFEEFYAWCNENEAGPGGDFEFFPDDGLAITHWSGIPNLHDYFVQFGSTTNGSMIGIWQTEPGKQIYMHLSADEDWGKELADNFVDFLRFLAIGYESLGFFTDKTVQELNVLAENEDINAGFNPTFKNWVETRFGTTVPNTSLAFKREGTPFNDWNAKKDAEYQKSPLLSVDKDASCATVFQGVCDALGALYTKRYGYKYAASRPKITYKQGDKRMEIGFFSSRTNVQGQSVTLQIIPTFYAKSSKSAENPKGLIGGYPDIFYTKTDEKPPKMTINHIFGEVEYNTENWITESVVRDYHACEVQALTRANFNKIVRFIDDKIVAVFYKLSE